MTNIKGYLYILLSAAFLSTVNIIGKFAILDGLNIFDIVTFQLLTSTILIFLFILLNDIESLNIGIENIKLVAIQGCLGAGLSAIFNILALQRLPANISTVLLFTHPIFIYIYFLTTKKRVMNRGSLIALLISMLGTALLMDVFGIGSMKLPIVGIMFGLCSSLAYAFYNIFADLKLGNINIKGLIFYTYLFSSITLSLFNPQAFTFDNEITLKFATYVSLLAIISGILPMIFLYKGIALLGSDKASISATLELPIAFILAFLLLGEGFDISQGVGAFMILLSVGILNISGITAAIVGLNSIVLKKYKF